MKTIIYGIGKIGIEFINDLLEVYKDIEIEALTDTYVRKLDRDRIGYYGQKDHVRLYGNDIVERIEKFGFEVELFRCNEVAEKECGKRFGFIDGDSVLLCKRIIKGSIKWTMIL